ncbi:MAG: hypothetical protein HEQ39_00860 [Rhizobacter sp.]
MNQWSIPSFFFFLSASLWSSLVTAAPQATQSCNVTQRSEAVVLMLCPPAQNEVTWRAAALKACEGKQRCNVWIWDDATNLPATAPATDAELPKSLTAKAVAIWAQDSQSLVALRKAGKK